MSDLENAKDLLMTISKNMSTETTSLQRAVEFLLRDYIKRAKEAKGQAND